MMHIFRWWLSLCEAPITSLYDSVARIHCVFSTEALYIWSQLENDVLCVSLYSPIPIPPEFTLWVALALCVGSNVSYTNTGYLFPL